MKIEFEGGPAEKPIVAHAVQARLRMNGVCVIEGFDGDQLVRVTLTGDEENALRDMMVDDELAAEMAYIAYIAHARETAKRRTPKPWPWSD